MRYSSVKVFRVKCKAKALPRPSFFSFRASFCRSALQQPHCLLAVHNTWRCAVLQCAQDERRQGDTPSAFPPPFAQSESLRFYILQQPGYCLCVCSRNRPRSLPWFVNRCTKLDSWLSSGSRPNVQAKARCTAAPPPCAATSPHAPRRRHRRSLRSFTHAPAASPGTAAQDLLQG